MLSIQRIVARTFIEGEYEIADINGKPNFHIKILRVITSYSIFTKTSFSKY